MWLPVGLIQQKNGKTWKLRAEANLMCYQELGKTGLKMNKVNQIKCHSGMWHALVEMKYWSVKSNFEKQKALLTEVGCRVGRMMHELKDKMTGLLGSDRDGA